MYYYSFELAYEWTWVSECVDLSDNISEYVPPGELISLEDSKPSYCESVLFQFNKSVCFIVWMMISTIDDNLNLVG